MGVRPGVRPACEGDAGGAAGVVAGAAAGAGGDTSVGAMLTGCGGVGVGAAGAGAAAGAPTALTVSPDAGGEELLAEAGMLGKSAHRAIAKRESRRVMMFLSSFFIGARKICKE